MNLSPQDTAGARRRALLAFADAPALDLSRRRWPRAFKPLLAHPGWTELAGDIDCHLFTSFWTTRAGVDPGVQVHRQRGRTFGESLSRAVQTLASLGYEEIVIVGSDCPSLSREDISLAFSGLGRHRAVLGPDHKGGVYLIGLHSCDSELLDSVGWNRNTDRRQLLERFGHNATLLLETRQDLDDLDDLRRLAAAWDRLGRVAGALLERLLAVGTAPTPPHVPCAASFRLPPDRAPPAC